MPGNHRLIFPDNSVIVLFVGAFMRVISGGYRSPGRHTDRVSRVGVRKVHSACGQSVKMRGINKWISVASERVKPELVGGNQQDIGFWGHFDPFLSFQYILI
jgi:hypothetical protein